MKFGFSGEAFGNLLVLSALLMIITMSVIFIIAKKRGINVTKHRFALAVLISCALFYGLIPFWLSDLPIKPKIIITILALAIGIGNYFAIDRMQRVLRDQLEDRKKKREDRR